MFVFLHQVFLPHYQIFIGLLQALDVANRLELVPQIWKGWWQFCAVTDD